MALHHTAVLLFLLSVASAARIVVVQPWQLEGALQTALPGDVIDVLPVVTPQPAGWPPVITGTAPVLCGIAGRTIANVTVNATAEALGLMVQTPGVTVQGACREAPTPLIMALPPSNVTVLTNTTDIFIANRKCTALTIAAQNVTINNLRIDNYGCMLNAPSGVFNTGGSTEPLAPVPAVLVTGWPGDPGHCNITDWMGVLHCPNVSNIAGAILGVKLTNLAFTRSVIGIVISRSMTQTPCATRRDCIAATFFADCATGPARVDSLTMVNVTFAPQFSAWHLDVNFQAVNFSETANVTIGMPMNSYVCTVIPSRPYYTAIRALLPGTSCDTMTTPGDTAQVCGSGDSVVKNTVPQDCDAWRRKQIDAAHEADSNPALLVVLCIVVAGISIAGALAIGEEILHHRNEAFGRMMPHVKRAGMHEAHGRLHRRFAYRKKTVPTPAHDDLASAAVSGLAASHALNVSTPPAATVAPAAAATSGVRRRRRGDVEQ